MQHLTFKSVMLSLAVIAMVGCSKEQSSFNIEDIPGKAKIMGTLSYDAGQGYTNGVYTQLIKGAAGVRVTAKVSNSSIKNSSEGYTNYETTTDANGNYSIEVPAVPNGTRVEIVADPFFATYSEVVGVENNNPKIESKEVLFKASSQNKTLSPNAIEIYDAIYSYNNRTEHKAPQYTAKFIVKVGQGYHKKTKNEDREDIVAYEYKEISGKDVLVKDNNDGKWYGATTNNNGEATFIIPTDNKAWQVNVEIDVPGYIEQNYKFYTEEQENAYPYQEVINSYTLQGVYQIYNSDKFHNFSSNGIEGTPTPVHKVRMIFAPFENEDNHGYDWPSYISWDDEEDND